jgi:hypothetical protein
VGEEGLEVQVLSPSRGLLGSLAGTALPEALLGVEVPSPGLPPVLQSLARELGPAAYLLEPPKLQARLEWTVEIR